MTTLYVAIGIGYILIGFAVALITYYGKRRHPPAAFWVAALIGILGAFIGGIADTLLGDLIERLTRVGGVLNVFPPTIAAVIAVMIFMRLSDRRDEFD